MLPLLSGAVRRRSAWDHHRFSSNDEAGSDDGRPVPLGGGVPSPPRFSARPGSRTPPAPPCPMIIPSAAVGSPEERHARGGTMPGTIAAHADLKGIVTAW